MPSPDDADALRRLQQLYHQQAAAAVAQGPGSAAAASAMRDAIREEVLRRLDDRLLRLRELQARANEMSHEQFMGAYAELFGTQATTPDALIQSVLDWVGRAVPSTEMRDRIFADVLRRIKA
jgi:hypothetical protein